MGKRYNIQLDEEHSARLEALAERTHVQAGTLARSLLSTAIDEADPSSGRITEILNAIPGAYERHQQGRRDAREGRTLPLDDL
jgi:predicted transcriptional regulator